MKVVVENLKIILKPIGDLESKYSKSLNFKKVLFHIKCFMFVIFIDITSTF